MPNCDEENQEKTYEKRSKVFSVKICDYCGRETAEFHVLVNEELTGFSICESCKNKGK